MWNEIKKEIDIKIGDEVKPLTESADRKGYYIYQSEKKIKEPNLVKLIIG